MIDIRIKTAELIQRDFDIPTPVTLAMFDRGLLDERAAVRVLIQDEYMQKIYYRRKTDIKIHLSERYCVSYSTVEKIVAGLNDNDNGQ